MRIALALPILLGGCVEFLDRVEAAWQKRTQE